MAKRATFKKNKKRKKFSKILNVPIWRVETYSLMSPLE